MITRVIGFFGLFLAGLQVANAAVVGLPSAAPLGIQGFSAAALPLDVGGLAAIATVSLVIGAQLIKRRK